ncbi:MAG TPA: CdvA-like protein [Candidatus Acidoferrum sp.]|nr:CdvA-like protein [Candidatus Acidoferrum sp.]
MAMLVENIGRFLGKAVQTPYNTPVGKLIAVDTNIRNEVTQVSVEQESGVLAKYPAAQVRIDNSSVVVMPAWKHEASDLEREYSTASKRITALKSLLSDGDIDTTSYREMASEYESALHAMESRRVALVDSLKEKTMKLEDEIRKLQLALTDNKLLYSSGVVEAIAYKEACQIIHVMLNGHLAEKKDIQTTLESLTSLEHAQSVQEQNASRGIEQGVPDFVVVKIKEEMPA